MTDLNEIITGTEITTVSNLGVLVIDMQTPFLKNLDNAGKLIKTQLRVLDYCTEYDLPVAEIRMEGRGRTVKEIRKKIRKVSRYKKFSKHTYSAFSLSNRKSGQNLIDQLERWEVQNLLFMGVYALDCVYHSAKGALECGFGILTARDLTDDFILGYQGKMSYYFRRNGQYFGSLKELFPLIK